MRRGGSNEGLSTGSPQTRSDQDGSERLYVLQNWRQDVVAIIDEAAVQRERVFYSPYGRIFGMVAGDTGVSGSAFDGSYGPADDTAITGWSGYDAYVDVDLDGDVDTTDAGYTSNDSLGLGVLSRDGSTVGYAGYVQDDYVPTVNHVRHRVYKGDLGRWVQRDPAGYVDGANLYEYATSAPINLRGPSGLAIDLIRLINHYFYGGGSDFELKGEMFKRYLKCPNVAAAIARIERRVKTTGMTMAKAAHDRISCE
ncbi:MAG: RHS repeat-associated core domain-containing protein [Phycisphaerales bacterium JB060]